MNLSLFHFAKDKTVEETTAKNIFKTGEQKCNINTYMISHVFQARLTFKTGILKKYIKFHKIRIHIICSSIYYLLYISL